MNITQKNYNTLTFTPDRYTKIVLTAIAVCLLFLSVNIILKPNDLNAVQTVQDVNLKLINGNSINREIPVDLKNINGRNIWSDEIPVNLESINGSSISGNELPVKIR